MTLTYFTACDFLGCFRVLYPLPFKSAAYSGASAMADEGTSVDMMSSSLYGSLDGDWRENDLVTSRDAMAQQQEMAQIERAKSLTSFYSTLGSVAAATSSRIGAQEDSSDEMLVTADAQSTSRASGGATSNESFMTSRQEKSVADAGNITSDASVASGGDPNAHVCLLDIIQIDFSDIDLFSAQWQPKSPGTSADELRQGNLVFPSYVIRRESGKILKEKGRLAVQTERNLEGEISHNVPDIRISAKLSSVHFLINGDQLKLVKGLLFHNFGETLEQFQTKLINFEDPKIQVGNYM